MFTKPATSLYSDLYASGSEAPCNTS